MYEQFRNSMISELSADLDEKTIRLVIEKLDFVAKDFDITEAQRSLVVWKQGLPEEAKYFLVSMKMRGLSDGTLKNYRLQLQIFFDIVRKPVVQICANDIRAYFYIYRQKKPISDRSADKYRQYLSSFFGWCTDNEYIQKNPMKSIEQIKFQSTPRQSLSRMELEEVREACATPMERVLVELMASSGCRIAELSVLKKEDIDMETRSIKLFGKGKKTRTNFITPKAILLLKEYYETRSDDSPYVIVGKYSHTMMTTSQIRRIFKKICSRAKLDKKCVPHMMRHTYATLALKAGMPLDIVSKSLGHSSVSTTQIYARRDVTDLQQAYDKYIS